PGGGAERVFVDVVNGLYQRGHDMAVLTFEPMTAASFYPLDNRTPRLTSVPLPTKGAPIKALRRLRQTVVNHAPDVLVAFMPSCYVPLSTALAFSGIPFIASEHNV